MINLSGLRPRTLWTSPSGPGWGPLPELLLALTLVTGLVDAVSILSLGRVFVANMTGNVVFTGFALVGAPGFSLSASLFALAGFLFGAVGGGFLTGKVGHDRALHIRAVMGLEFGLLAAALIVVGFTGGATATTGTLGIPTDQGAFGAAVTHTIAFVLAVAMGIRNSAVRKLAVPDLTTTVLTMTLIDLGADSRVARGGHLTLKRRLLFVATMFGGGALGAWLVLNIGVLAALALAAGILAATALCAALAVRHPGGWRGA